MVDVHATDRQFSRVYAKKKVRTGLVFLVLFVILGGLALIALRNRETNLTEAAQSAKASITSHQPDSYVSAANDLRAKYNADVDITKTEAKAMAAYRQRWDSENSRPIQFYGQVLDQDRKPVAGATIEGRIIRYGSMTKEAYGIVKTVTDEQGLFQFENLHGIDFGLQVVLAGYTFDNRQILKRDEKYYSTTPSTRYILWVWRQVPQEHVERVLVRRMLPVNGTRQTIAIPGISGAGTELEVAFQRTPQDVNGAKRYDWSVEIKLPNGGTAAPDSVLVQEAPSRGYQERFSFHMASDSPVWSDSLDRLFFFEAAGGKYYGSFALGLSANTEGGAAYSEYDFLVNTQGGRYLQYDRKSDPALRNSR